MAPLSGTVTVPLPNDGHEVVVVIMDQTLITTKRTRRRKEENDVGIAGKFPVISSILEPLFVVWS